MPSGPNTTKVPLGAANLHPPAKLLNTSADSLLFDEGERGPETPSLRLRLEALDQLDPEEQATVLAVIEGALLRHQIRQVNVS